MRKPLLITGLAGTAILMAATLASAQMGSTEDRWTHTTAAAANGQCWVQTDKPYMERGVGYWGACPEGATPAISPQARRAHAQATTGPIAQKNTRHY